MKKILSISLAIAMICTSLIILNLYRTAEIKRVNDIEMTDSSFKFYVKNTTKTDDETLKFFKNISNQYTVSIVKTDITNKGVLKSVILNKETFPNFQISHKRIDFDVQNNKVYTNKDIPIFFDVKQIEIQSMNQYFKDSTKSINGTYSITSTHEINKEAIMNNLSEFFNQSIDDLNTPSTFLKVGIVNQNLIVSGVIISLCLVIIVIGSIYNPINNLKLIGVKKLLGFSNQTIFLETVAPLILILISVGLIIDVLFLFSIKNSSLKFFAYVFISQFSLILIYVIISLIVQVFVNKITVVSMLKNFSNFNLGLYVSYGVKIIVVSLLCVLVTGISLNMKDMFTQLNYQKIWEQNGKNYVTVENYIPSDRLWENIQLRNSESTDFFYNLYTNIRNETSVEYVRSEQLSPSKIFNMSNFTNLNSMPVMYVDTTYLENAGLFKDELNQIKANPQKNFFIPKKYESEETTLLAKELYKSLFSFEEQKNINSQDLSVNIIFYDVDISTFSYMDSPNLFINPLFVLVDDDHMLFEEKAYLSDTGLSNPMKIKKTANLNKKLSKIVNNLDNQTKINFSTLSSIKATNIDSIKDGIKNISILSFILGVLNISISTFIVSIVFLTKRDKLMVTKFLGWKLFDRYKPIIYIFTLIYLVPIITLFVTASPIIVLMIFWAYIFLDIMLLLVFAYFHEKKRLNLAMKEK